MIQFDNVNLGYGKTPVLKDVTCSITIREIVGLVGPNGAGKTTFLRGLLGLLPIQQGKMSVDRSKKFAYVPQTDELNLFWPLTVRQVVSLASRSQRWFGKLTMAQKKGINEALAWTGISEIADQMFSKVSGGQRQRAILAQALSQRPHVLLLDEPTRGLDAAIEHDFLHLVQGLKKMIGLTVIIVTHSLQIPLNVADKILLFQNGHVIPTTPDELVQTNKLDEIYGVRFIHQSRDGVRWVAPAREIS